MTLWICVSFPVPQDEIFFSEAILGTLPFPHPLPVPNYMGSALAFVCWQKVLAIMHFIFTNIRAKGVTQIYEVL